MKWWWRPSRKRAWLKQEDAYWAARFNAFWSTAGNPLTYWEHQARLNELRPEGWTRQIESRRWNSWNPRRRRWTA